MAHLSDRPTQQLSHCHDDPHSPSPLAITYLPLIILLQKWFKTVGGGEPPDIITVPKTAFYFCFFPQLFFLIYICKYTITVQIEVSLHVVVGN